MTTSSTTTGAQRRVLALVLAGVCATACAVHALAPPLTELSAYRVVALEHASAAQQRAVRDVDAVLHLPATLELDVAAPEPGVVFTLVLRSTARHVQTVQFTDGSPAVQLPLSAYDGMVRRNGVPVTDSLAHLNVQQVRPLLGAGYFIVGDDYYRIEPHGTDEVLVFREKDWTGYEAPGSKPLGCGSGSGHIAGAAHAIRDRVVAPRTVNPLLSPKSVLLGVFVDCNVYASNGNSLNAVTTVVTGAIAFANSRLLSQMNLNLLLGSNSLVVDTSCTAGTSYFQNSCASSPTINQRHSALSTWRSQRGSTEGIWVGLTNCYQAPGTVGLAWTRALCLKTLPSPAVAIVSVVTASQQAFHIVFAHEVGHVFAAVHDEDTQANIVNGAQTGGSGCSTYGLPNPSNYIMATTVPTSPASGVPYSQCSVEWISYNVQNYGGVSNQLAPCLDPFGSIAITTVSPAVIASFVPSTITLTIGSEYLQANRSYLGLSFTSCASVQYLVQLPTATIDVNVPLSRTWALCYSGDFGSTWVAQASGVMLRTVEATTTSITALSPRVVVVNNAAVVTFTGADQVPSANVGFSATPNSCSTLASTASVSSNSTTTIGAIGTPGVYYLCYITTLGTWVPQLTNLTLTVIVQSPTLLADLSPSAIVFNTANEFTTTSQIATPQTRLAFTATTNCSTVVSVMSPDALNGYTQTTVLSTPGIYGVCVSTTSGTSWAKSSTLSLAVVGLPSPPSALQTALLTASRCTISWTDGFSNYGTLYSYQVVYNLASTPGTTQSFTKYFDGTPSATITGLSAGTAYAVRVTAYNIAGASTPSATLDFTTTAATAPGPIGGVSTAGSTPVSLVLTWSPPVETGGVPLTNYRILIFDSGTFQRDYLLDADTTTVTVPNVTPGRNYTAQIRAINTIGQAPIADFTVATPFATVPSEPRDVGTFNVTTNAFIVAWSAPLSDGGSPITSYYIVVYVDGATEDGPAINVSTTVRSASFDSLFNITQGTSYNVFVYARNIVGIGPASTLVNLRTDSGDLLNTIYAWIQQNLGAFIGIVVGVAVALFIVIIAIVYACRRASDRQQKQAQQGRSMSMGSLSSQQRQRTQTQRSAASTSSLPPPPSPLRSGTLPPPYIEVL